MKKLLNFIAGKIEVTQGWLHAFVRRQDQLYVRNPAAYKNKMDWFFFWSVLAVCSTVILAIWGPTIDVGLAEWMK